MKISLLISDAAKILVVVTYIVFLIAEKFVPYKLAEDLPKIMIIIECVWGLVYFFSSRIYKTDGYQKKAIISEDSMPEEFNKLYKEVEEKYFKNLEELRKKIPFIKIAKWSIEIGGAVIAYSLLLIIMNADMVMFYLWMILSIFITMSYFYLKSREAELEKKYKDYYKENCIKKIIEFLNPNLIYKPRDIEKETEYKLLYNDSKCDDIKRYRFHFR